MLVNPTSLESSQLNNFDGRLPNGRAQISKLLEQIVSEDHLSTVCRFDSLEAIREQAKVSLLGSQRSDVVVSLARSMAWLVKLEPNIRQQFKDQWRSEYKVMMKLCEDIISQVRDLSSYDLSNVAKSVSLMGVRHEELFGAISTEFQRRQEEITAMDLACMARAYAFLDIRDGKLTSFIGKVARQLQRSTTLEPFSMSSRAMIGWSLALLDPAQVACVINPRFLIDNDCELQTWGHIYQALLVTEAIGPYEYFPRRQELWGMEAPKSSNHFELTIMDALSRFLRKVPHVIEDNLNVAGVMIDFVLYLEDRTIAIECDGSQYHYSTGPDGGRLFGLDLIQNQILARCGMEVVHIASSELNVCSTVQLLSQKLGMYET